MDRHPLTFPQQAIFLDSLMRGATAKFNMGGAMILRGALDEPRFRASLAFALASHDCQRIRLEVEGEAVHQRFLPVEDCPLPYQFLDFSTRSEPLQAAIAWVLEDFNQPMRLDQFPLHGDVLFRLGPDLHLWYPKFHHLANDALGHAQLAATVAAAYNEHLGTGAWPERDVPSYLRFIEDDRAYAESARFSADQAFWQRKFDTLPEPLPFTARKGGLKGDRLHTERCALHVNRLLYNSMLRRAEEAEVTPFHVLLSCLFAYLNRSTGQDDLVIGTPIMNRSNHGFRTTPGMFMNMMPLRLQVARDATLMGLAAQIQGETRSCYRHQRFPLGEILRYGRTRDGFCQGLFDVTMIYRKADYAIDFGGASMRVITLDTGAREETLSLEVDDYGGDEEVNLFFNFNPQLLSVPEVEQMARAFERMLVDLALQGDVPVRELRLGTGLTGAAAPAGPRPEPEVLALVARRVAENPEAVALVAGETRLTRAALQAAANRCAAYLAGPGAVRPEQPVAVLCGRSSDWIIALLGVLKAGGAYLPLDPDQPRERLAFILQDSGCQLLLTDLALAPFAGVRTVPVAEAAAWAEPAAPVALAGQDLAYVIYTSGTTGQPKGVLVEHASFANTVQQLQAGWGIGPRDKVLGFAGPMFDASIVDIFLALGSGATLVLAAKEVILDSTRFLDLLRQERVTVATLPPAYLSALGPVSLPLRLLVTAGEAANPADVARQVRHLTYVNAYGPTEGSVCASYLRLEAGTEFRADRVSIGTPIGNTRILVLDEDLAPVPLGAPGELCLAGAGLARGYLGQPELTAERFVSHPAGTGERLYRTGDLGRLLADGSIEYLGRRDLQVKIRGYRVELGEVETILKTHPAVATAAVTTWTGAAGTELVAYVVARGSFDPRTWRRFLAGILPAYMVPTRWIAVPALPLTGSGKVDLAALPDAGSAEDLGRGPGALAPRTALERTLAGIWEEVLERTGIGVEDDFFELGGHSLRAVRVLARIQDRLQARVAMTEFFSNPTVAGLAACLEGGGRSPEAPIPVCAEQASYPVSNAQARLWVLAQMPGGLAAYNMPLALEMRGELRPAALEAGLRAVIGRHESLRTGFQVEQGLPRQKVLSPELVRFDLIQEDLRGCADPDAEGRLRLRGLFSAGFDLTQAPLLRAGVFQTAADRWLLALVVHHSVADGWSLDVLLRELGQAYGAALLGAAPDWPALAMQYRDYSQWLARSLEQDALGESRGYWQQVLAGPLPVLELPADHARPLLLGFAGQLARCPLTTSNGRDLAGFCGQHGVTPFMVLLTAVFGLLHRMSGDRDLILGTPVANRERIQLEGQIGLYLNTLPLRVQADPDQPLAALLDQVRAAVLGAQAHQAYPFDTLIQDLKVKRSTDRNPLFDVMVVMQDALRAGFTGPGLEARELELDLGTSVFDLTFHFSRGETGLRLDLEYNTGLFKPERIQRLTQHLDRMLAHLVDQPGQTLAEVDLLAPEERAALVGAWAQGPALPRPEQTVLDRFAEQVRLDPAAPAVVFGSTRLSYGQLAEAAAAVAGRVRAAGVQPGAVVALVVNRSAAMVAGVIGIMAAGAVCLAIDPGQPRERLLRFWADSGCQAVLSDGVVIDAAGLPLLALEPAAGDPVQPWFNLARLEDVAYLTYTSGSTGMPKGSLIEHRSLANLATALGPSLYDLLPRPCRELVLTSLAFDVAMKQLFGALTRGNTLVIAGEAERQDPAALMATLVREDLHLLDLTPTHFAVLLAQGFGECPKPSLRALVLGSEPVPCALVEAFRQHPGNRAIAILNCYGPSECTVETLVCRLDGRDLSGTRFAPIGRPVANGRVYLLAPDGKPVPIGIPGEICLGGLPVGRGYLARPELNAAKFQEDPFELGGRIYHSGDRGRWAEDGTVEFLGREDGQVKIRGYRIEPGEVEYHLLQHPGVGGAFVEGRTGPAGTLELVAWYLPAGRGVEPALLRAHLSRSLPSYLVPARLVPVAELPVKSQGKIDRLALPDPWTSGPATPGNPVQGEVAAAVRASWQTVLGLADLDGQTSFFDAGGNSLLLVRLHSLLEERFPGLVKLPELFSAPSLEDQVRLLEARLLPVQATAGPAPGCRPAAVPEDHRIAIIGIGLRVGECQDLDQFWSELVAGRDFVRPLPEHRRQELERLAAAMAVPLTEPAFAELGYLDTVDCFDFAHFRLAPAKAALLDPREKLFLETAWHALEDAGYASASLKGTRTGVFLGESTGAVDFARILEVSTVQDPNQLLESLTPSLAAGRLSYLLDLHGPALLVDTACSSALSALDLAMQALRSGQCELALAGSVKLHLLPFERPGRTEIEASDGRTRSYDDAASGTGGGEASLAFLLKPLGRALADGDPIHAVLRGVASNQDGASTGITAPNADAQADVIDRAWQDAELDPDHLDFIEGHGTGTRLGDPIEVQGLTQAFRRYTQRRQFCALGSIKANLGHTDHAAGLAGLLRAVACLEHATVAPVVHFQSPNRAIPFETSPLFVHAEPRPLADLGRPAVAGVSSFGLSGTNVHVVVEAAPVLGASGAEPEPGRTWLVPLSARTPNLLRTLGLRLGRYLERHPDRNLVEVVATLALGRDHLGARAALRAGSVLELAATLAAWAEGPLDRPELGVVHGCHKVVPASKPVLQEFEVTESALEALTEASAALCRRGDPEGQAELARLYVAGARVPWAGCFAETMPRRCGLPGYPFERTRSWPELRAAGFSLLGRLQAETPDQLIFESSWRADSHWLLAEHRLQGVPVLVGSGYLQLAQDLARQLWNTDRVLVKRLDLLAPLSLEGPGPLRVVVRVQQGDRVAQVEVASHQPGRGWQVHASAELGRLAVDHQERLDLDALRERCQQPVPVPAAGEGPAAASARWSCLRQVHRQDDLWCAELAVAPEHRPGLAEFSLYPPMVDVALNFATGGGEFLPLGFSGLRIHGRLGPVAWAQAKALPSSETLPRFSVSLADSDGKVVFSVDDYVLKAPRADRSLEACFQQLAWTAAVAEADLEPVADLYSIPAGAPEAHWRTWLAEQPEAAALRMVLQLPVLASAAQAGDAELGAVLEPVFTLAQALISRSGPAQLLVVGRLAHPVSGQEPEVDPLHAAVAAWCRVPEQETGNLCCRFLDSEPGAPADLDRRGFARAFAGPQPILAWRQGGWWVPAVAPLALVKLPERAFTVREGGSYLLTGGTGGMALAIAQHLASQARVELVLATRKPFPEPSQWPDLAATSGDPWLKAKAETLLAIEALGSTLRLETVDLGSPSELRRLRDRYPGLRAVFHCAGVRSDGFLAGHSWDRVLEVLRPKIQASAALCAAFQDAGLDALVLASSVTACTGAPGQAAYTAGNAYQLALAEQLRSPELPVLALAWSTWKETGMAAEAGRVLEIDYRSLATSQALRCLDQALTRERAQLIIAEPIPVQVPAPVANPAVPAVPAPGPGANLEPCRLLGRADGAYTGTEATVAAIWAKALGHEELDIYASYEDLGGDSITAIEILLDFRENTPFEPSLPELYRYPTIEGLAAYLDERQFLTQRGPVDFSENLVPLGGTGSRKVFCFAPGSGSSYRYYQMARRLVGWDVFGVNFLEVEAPAEALAGMLEAAQPEGPFTLLGYSIGGNLAYEVAQVLLARGREITGLVFLDNWRRLELLSFSDEAYRTNAEAFLAALDPKFLASAGRDAVVRRVERYDRYMDSRMEDRPVPFPIRLIQAEFLELQPAFRLTQEGWAELTPDFQLLRGSGRHLQMLDVPFVEANSALVQGLLDGLVAEPAAGAAGRG